MSVEFESVTDVADNTELANVITYELAALLLDPGSEAHLDQTSNFMVRQDDDVIEARWKQVVTTEEARITADIGLLFKKTQAFTCSQEVTKEFVEGVAIMVLVPFIREAVFAAAARLGVAPPLLPLVRPGQLTLS